jgi:hypothetical protein
MPQRTLTAWLYPPAGSPNQKKDPMKILRKISEPDDKSGKNYSRAKQNTEINS